MGDRANIVLHERGGGRLYFYTHWRGRDLPRMVQRALGRQTRWDDEAYLARILFSEMTAEEPGGSLNYGISTYLGDNQYPLLVVDVASQTVDLVSAERGADLVPERSWTFDEFVCLNLGQDAWDALSCGHGRGGTQTEFAGPGLAYTDPGWWQDAGPAVVPLDMLENLFIQTTPPRKPYRRARRRR